MAISSCSDGKRSPGRRTPLRINPRICSLTASRGDTDRTRVNGWPLQAVLFPPRRASRLGVSASVFISDSY
jgi:hypothetical protein